MQGTTDTGSRGIWPQAEIARFPIFGSPSLSREPCMTDLTIIFTTWNSLNHIRKCIESILPLDMPTIETIVVDSNSTDGTRDYLERLSHSPEASKLGLKVLLLDRRTKWSEANQIGLDHSSGEWVCLSNPDIVFNESFPKMLKSCSSPTELE